MSNKIKLNRHQLNRRYVSQAFWIAYRVRLHMSRSDVAKILNMTPKQVMKIKDANMIMPIETLTDIITARLDTISNKLK